RKQAEAAEEVANARKELAARDEGARLAAEFYTLLKDGKKADALARWPELQKAKLSPVETQYLQENVMRARAEVVDAAYAGGVEAARSEQWKKASTELKRALAFEEDGPRAAQMHYYYGVSLVKQGDYQEAVRQLDLALAGGVERSVGSDARFHLATALELGKQ